MNWCRTRNVTFFSRSIAVSKISGWLFHRLWKQNVARPGRECGVSLQLRVFRAEANIFPGRRLRARTLVTRCTGGINIYTVGRFDSKPKLTSAKFSVENFFRVIAPSSNVWILFIPSEISFLEILFLNVPRDL